MPILPLQRVLPLPVPPHTDVTDEEDVDDEGDVDAEVDVERLFVARSPFGLEDLGSDRVACCPADD